MISAATYIARARQNVLVIDAGKPRNRFANASHGFFGHDGIAPAAMIANARAQLLSAYPNVTFVAGEAVGAAGDPHGFEITLDTGRSARAARIVLATGVADELPDFPGLRERWGKTVIHCPYLPRLRVQRRTVRRARDLSNVVSSSGTGSGLGSGNDFHKQTSVPGVFAAGDAARVPHSVARAVADGVTAGVSLHRASVMQAIAA